MGDIVTVLDIRIIALISSCCDAGRALISASFPKAAMRWMALVRCPPI